MSDETPMTTFTVKGTDGKEIQYSVPTEQVHASVAGTHVSKERIASDLDKRVQSIVKSKGYRTPDEMLDDADFATRVAEKHGFSKTSVEGDSAAAKQLQEAVRRALADQETKVIKPLTEKLTAKEKRESDLLVKGLEQAIVTAAAENGVKKSLLKGAIKGKSAAIVALLEDAFALDEETGEFFVSDGKDGFVLSTSQDAGQTYMTPAEFVAGWAADPANADYIDRAGQGGAGVGGGARGGPKGNAGGIIWLTAEQAGNAETYAKALEQAGGDYAKVKVKREQSAF